MAQENVKNKNDFTKGPMWKAVVKMAVPLMLAQLVTTMYNVVDRMYIGHMDGAGSMALTGLGLAMPLIGLINAFSALFGSGGGPLCSIARGRGDMKEAERIMGNSLTMLLIVGVAITVLFEIFLKPMLFLLGASEATYPYASEYAKVYILGTIFVMLSMGMNYFINAQGFGRVGMLTVAIGAVLNIILDPIMIFAMDMGIRGAAIATVISQAVSAAWAMGFICSKKSILDLTLPNMRLQWSTLRRILALGVTGFVMQATGAVVMMTANLQLRTYGSDYYVGAMTVINSLKEVCMMVCLGMTNGAQPVLGYNYGAGAYGRVKQGIRFSAVTTVSYTLLCWAIVMLFPGALTKIFNNDPSLLEVAKPAMRVYFCGFTFLALQMTGQSTFVGLGKSKQAICFSLLRKVVIVVPIMLLLPHLPRVGVMGVFWSEPISDFLGGFACVITMYLTVYRKLGEDQPRKVTEENKA